MKNVVLNFQNVNTKRKFFMNFIEILILNDYEN